MALLTVHHWENLEAGIEELCRIAPLRVVFTFDPAHQSDFWLVGWVSGGALAEAGGVS